MIECVKVNDLYKLNISGYSSKGNQLKARDEDYWYKADYMGYEGLAEYVVSTMLSCSNIKNYVSYDLVKLECDGLYYTGCKSRNFLRTGENLITLEHLYRQFTGQGLAKRLAQIEEVSDKIEWLVKVVQDITGWNKFGQYLTAMLEIDAFFLNEDRHTNNIAIIYDKERDRYRTCEYFDQGLALFADTTTDFGLGKSVEECIEKVEAKPFSRDFDEQMDAAEKMYGQQLYFTFSIRNVEDVLALCRENYSEEICMRVLKLFRYQMRKYTYFFREK